MNIEERIESAMRERTILGLTVPNLVLLNPQDMAEFIRIIYAKMGPFPVPSTKMRFEAMEYRTDDGALRVVCKGKGEMELKCEIEINGLQLLLRTLEKMDGKETKR